MDSIASSTENTSPITETKMVCLSTSNARVIFEQISIFYRENEFFDTVIMAGKKDDNDHVSISAHRMVLSALSQYFREAYRDAQTVMMKNILEFPEIDPQILKLIVDFMYSGTIELNIDIVERVLCAAIFLKIHILIECCCEFIEKTIDPSNCILCFRLSSLSTEESSLCNIKEKSMEFIYLNFDKLSKEEEFLMLTEKEIKNLLSYENRHSDIEEAVFTSVLAWINYDKPNREHLVVELLKMIHYQLLSIKFITDNMSVCKSVESFELISDWLKYHVSPETRITDQKQLDILMQNDPQTLKSLNEFLHSGSIELNIEIVERILRAAVFLKFKHLIEVCCEFVEENINSSNCISWFRLSTELSLCSIREKSMNLIYMNFEQMSELEEFLMLTEKEIKNLLSHKNPYTDFEEEVFKAILAWLNYDKPIRKHLTVDLLKKIRYQYLTTKFIAENIPTCKSVECYELVTGWLKYHLSPETRTTDLEISFKSRFGGLLFVNIEESNTIAIQMYNCKTDEWDRKIQIPFDDDILAFSTLVFNNKLFIVGGVDSIDLSYARDDIKSFDLCTLEWIDKSRMHYKRKSCQLAELDGQLCIYGGYHSECFVSVIELYNPTTGKIIELKPPYPERKSKMCTGNGVLYLLSLGLLQFYNSSTRNWKAIQIPSQPIKHVGFAADQKFLYILDGHSNVKRFDLEKKSWIDSTELREPHQPLRSMIFNNKIVIFSVPLDRVVVFNEYDTNTKTWRKLTRFIIKFGMLNSCSMGSYNP